ncbi:MAG: hypothetical protein JXR12_01555 [Neptunomonas phycophila]|uniref:hypothetical protein n=1 Tax=Neptunomonas phycophila TaxID=1572645 RepID=UPI003B8AE108
MSTFDQYADTPNQIKFEGQEVVLTFERISPSTARVSWNIPPKSSRCGSDNPPAYDGIVITLDTTHTNSSKLPSDGQVYIGDPTADNNLHAGDKIGEATVVGSFYGDRTTTSIDITGLTGNTPYYFSAHAVDKQLRYHKTGVHAYSQDYGNEAEPGTPAKQNIRVGAPDVGVLPSDPTNLVAGELYSIEAILDNDRKHTFTFDGADVPTYDDLVEQWERQVLLIDNPLMSPVHPNTGFYYFDKSSQSLYQWDGTKQVPINAVTEHFAPSAPTVGQLWWNLTTLSKWDGSVWVPQILFQTTFDPTAQECDQHWFDGTTFYEWTGTVWKDVQLLTGVDPSLPIKLPKSAHWYNENDYTLYKMNNSCSKWTQTIAQLWNEDPTTPTVDQYWFDEINKVVQKWDGSVWVAQTAIIVESELPTVAPTGSIYYVEDDMELFEESNGSFVKVPVFVWDKDPTQPNAGDLWWDEDDSKLYQWSERQTSWIEVTPFNIQSTDPRLAPELDVGTYWFDGTIYHRWDGSEWHQVKVVEYLTNPHELLNGVYWNDGHTIFELVNGTWTAVDTVGGAVDPFTPTVGDFWFDLSADVLYQYNGATYVVTPYVSNSLIPQIGTQYFNTTDSKLLKWNGQGWIGVDPLFTVKLDGTVIRLETLLTGSCARIEVGDFTVSSLFEALDPIPEPFKPVIGTDGLEPDPSYAQEGVGTDGSTDERRELIDSIRHQLGYPQVDVELTKQQFDYAIDGAIESLRKRSGMAYKRGFYFMDFEAGKQHYKLTDKKRGYNKITSITKIHRVRSSFLSNAAGSGLYGQIALQQMYQMGSFDLISYHLVSQYTETLNQMFAGDVMFNWNEDNREMMIFKNMHKDERMLVEVVVERTEQNMLKDRYLKGWIEKYALCQARYMLAEIRGKFAALPGAGGGVALNAQELAARADQELLDLYQQLDDFVADNPEEYGAGSTVIFG